MMKVRNLILIILCLFALNACKPKTADKVPTDPQLKKEYDRIRSFNPANRLFDSKGWLKADAKERSLYTSDIITNQRLRGKTKGEILKLMGKPERESANKVGYKIDLSDPNTPVWYLVLGFDSSSRLNRTNLTSVW